MGIVTAAKLVAVSVSVCLSLISGGPFGAYCILLYLVGMCVWEGGVSSWGVSVPSETFTKVMFGCLWWAPLLHCLRHWGLDCLLLLVISGLGEARLHWGDPHMGLGTAYSLGLNRRAQVAQREIGGPQPHRWPSGKVC